MRLRRDTASEIGVARLAFTIIVALTACNLLFNLVAAASGQTFPYTTFLYDPADRIADYFKLSMSYPGGTTIVSATRFAGARDLFAHYIYNHHLAADGQVPTNLHMMPVTTVFTLLNLAAMTIVDPLIEYLVVSAAMLAGAIWIVVSVSRDDREMLLWIGAALLSYPMLLTLDRGNLPAGITALSIIAAMLLAARRRAVIVSAILLAIAVNVRPNAIVFAIPLLFLHRNQWFRAFLALGVAGFAILGVSLVAAHALYPAYTLEGVVAGVRGFHDVYVVGDVGLPYSSSLLGAIKVLFGYSARAETAAAILAGLILCGGVLLWLSRRITASTFLFLVCASYALGSSTIADYHLLVFLAPLLCRGLETAGRSADDEIVPRIDPLLVVGASCLVLSPKNYMFIHIVSYQVLLNPLLLLAAALLILYRGWRPPALALP